MRPIAGSLCSAVLAVVSIPSGAAEPDVAAALFRERVAALFERRCANCHNDTDRKGGLTLTTAASAFAGGDSGPPIAPGAPDSSYLLDLVTAHDGHAAMPKDGTPLSA